MRPIIHRDEWRWVALVSAFVIVISVGLNVWFALNTPPTFHFNGFVYGWDDGNSYLATMREGKRGMWLYTLPYSAEPGEPFFLFIHYIALGHFARWLDLNEVVVFHGARLLGGALLLVSLYALVARFFVDVRTRRYAFALIIFGSGLGWLSAFLGHTTPDWWQAEAFPFLSILANVHFPWAMAAFVWLIDLLTDTSPTSRLNWLRLIVGAMLLSLIQPYALVTIVVVAALWSVMWIIRHRSLPLNTLLRAVIVGIAAAPFALYYRWALENIPSYRGWEQQDITLSPPPTDYLIAGGVAQVFALIGIAVMARTLRRETHADALLLLIWIVVSPVLMYLPVIHQRRFAFALFIPLAILAVIGITHGPQRWMPRLRALLLIFASLGNILLLLIILLGTSAYPRSLFFTRAEWEGITYLRNTMPDQIVLSSPEMGLFIPAWSDQRVVYGHPNETLNAKLHRAEVEQFFAGTLANADTFLRSVDFIFVGPRERALGTPVIPSSFAVVFSDGDVTIYARK
jgi:hypothetical protein